MTAIKFTAIADDVAAAAAGPHHIACHMTSFISNRSDASTHQRIEKADLTNRLASRREGRDGRPEAV